MIDVSTSPPPMSPEAMELLNDVARGAGYSDWEAVFTLPCDGCDAAPCICHKLLAVAVGLALGGWHAESVMVLDRLEHVDPEDLRTAFMAELQARVG